MNLNTKKTFYSLLFICSTLVGFAQDTIHLKPYVSELKSVEVFINDKKYNFLFDAGGGETLISPDVAKLLNKEIYGCSTGIRMDGEMIKYQKADSISIKIGATEIFHQTIGVWDIMSILPSRFANGTDGAELTIFIGLPKYGNRYWFLFDTGNIGPVILSPECATLWGLQSNTKDSKPLSKLEFIIGRNKIEINSYSKKIIYDGVLNFESISKYIFTIDFRKKEVWVN